MSYYCYCCGDVEGEFTADGNPHESSSTHKSNHILYIYKQKKDALSGNRHGVNISCDVRRNPVNGENVPAYVKKGCVDRKIKVNALPNQHVKFLFKIKNEMKDKDIIIVGVQLGHPQKQFQMNNHQFVFGDNPHLLSKKSTVKDEVSVTFRASDIGQFEMPIMFTFLREEEGSKKSLVIVREMVIIVDHFMIEYEDVRNPYTNKVWEKADRFIKSTVELNNNHNFTVPKLLKILAPRGLELSALDSINDAPLKEELRLVQADTRSVFEEGVTESNYIRYFHYLLWWEEVFARINLRKYNMEKVTLERRFTPEGAAPLYVLEVPGLAEKRPSLMKGDRVYIRPCDSTTIMFESSIKETEDNFIQITGLDDSFARYYSPVAKFDIRFIMSRVPLERMHKAGSLVFSTDHASRVFPEPCKRKAKVQRIDKFYNPQIENNTEQRLAVEHIVAKASGLAPYMVFGPPGTGKTMTIVEAIIQLVVRNPTNKIMVCTDSNMAADNIALALQRYSKRLNINNYLFRANSQNRVWNVLPPELENVSNGHCNKSFYPVTNAQLSMYRVVVTTLLHAAKFGSDNNQKKYKLQMSHLFIDEAAQALEPACLVPITGLLAPSGQLVLAGDPKQLGPVVISRKAGDLGLSTSLMERLKNTYSNLYGGGDHRYITMLVKNYRSDPAILELPNERFYDGKLEPFAKPDPLSKVCILKDVKGGGDAIVFHGVNSTEQRVGKAPSYFNEKELQMLNRYVTALVREHNVAPKDIGVITPYKRQVYKVDGLLKNQNLDDIEVGTVEAFQGKEKRVILISTVRANCKLLDYDEKYSLGFIKEPKRFNVALTRAKAKLIIIGNATCLVRDDRWAEYMKKCRALGTYLGEDTEQMPRTEQLLHEISITRFNRCRITPILMEDEEKNKKKKEEEDKKKKKK